MYVQGRVWLEKLRLSNEKSDCMRWRGSGKNDGIPNIPSMLRLSLTAYIRISASNHLFCIYEVPKRSFDKRGTCTYEINIGKPWKTEGNHVCDKRPHRYCFLFIKDLWKNGIGTMAQFIYDGIFSHCKTSPIDQIGKNKLCFETKMTKVYSKIYQWKVLKTILFFYLYFTWLCASWKLKRILEK